MPGLCNSEDCAQDFLYARKTLYQLSYNPALGVSVFLTAKVNPTDTDEWWLAFSW